MFICVEELVLIATKFQHELNAVAADTFSGRENDLGWVSWAMSSKPKPSLTRYTDFSVRQTDQRQCQLWMISNFSLTRMLRLCLSASRLLSLLHSLSVLIFDSGPANWRIIHNFFSVLALAMLLSVIPSCSFRFWPFLWHKTFWVLASWIAIALS